MKARTILNDLAMSDFITESRAEPRVAKALALLQAEMIKVIGEDDIKKPNSDDYDEWTVCDTCDVILDELTDPADACICDRRNQLRAEQRKRLKEFIEVEK